MKKIWLSFLFLLVSLTLLWVLADSTLFSSPDLSSLRISLLNYTGIVAIGLMSAGMVLAVRLPTVNNFLGGLDKSYRLHKWLGIAAFILAVMHWLLVKIPQWTLGWGENEPPAPQANFLLDFFRDNYSIAVEIGDIDFKFFVVLVVLALVKQFPYKYFFKTHRLLAIVYLFLIIHSVMLMNFVYWDEVIAPVTVLLALGGAIAAFISLFRKIGQNRLLVGVIDELTYLEESDVLRVVVEFKEKWPGHEAGQFAFVTFDRREGPHPFTISSPWTDNGKMFFLIKGLGDYTSNLQNKLTVGDYVEIEGPYGKFNFVSGKDKQIWVAAGIGIAPFVARLKALGKGSNENNKEIDLFYTAKKVDQTMISKIKKSAEEGNIHLHIIDSAKDARLDFNRIRELVPKWQMADIWFCGPTGFGKQLKKDAVESGVSPDDFHQELFEMR